MSISQEAIEIISLAAANTHKVSLKAAQIVWNGQPEGRLRNDLLAYITKLLDIYSMEPGRAAMQVSNDLPDLLKAVYSNREIWDNGLSDYISALHHNAVYYASNS